MYHFLIRNFYYRGFLNITSSGITGLIPEGLPGFLICQLEIEGDSKSLSTKMQINSLKCMKYFPMLFPNKLL